MGTDLRHILITGAGGYIGGHIARECLERGCYVHALVHRNIPLELKQLEQQGKLTIWPGDICDAGGMAELMVQLPPLDAVIHCAAKTTDVGRERAFKTANFTAVQILGRLALQYNIRRFVFISTTDVYGLHDFGGETEAELKFDEKAVNPYPKYKIMAEKWLTANLSPQRLCIIRPAAVWGENDTTLTKRARDFLGWSPYIIHFGRWRGQSRWPLANVNNVAKAAYWGAFAPDSQGKAIQVLDSAYTTIDAFYRNVAAQYHPGKKYRTLCLPLWCGRALGGLSTIIADLLNLKSPPWDPTLYALYSVSQNLDFSNENFIKLLETNLDFEAQTTP